MNVLQTVDAKKLEKAEAKLKAKHVRRNDKDGQKTSTPLYVPQTLSLDLCLLHLDLYQDSRLSRLNLTVSYIYVCFTKTYEGKPDPCIYIMFAM